MQVSQDLAQWSETRNAGILDSISAKIEGANAELQSRVAAAEPAQSPAQAASEQQAQAAALAKINAINSRLAQVLSHLHQPTCTHQSPHRSLGVHYMGYDLHAC